MHSDPRPARTATWPRPSPHHDGAADTGAAGAGDDRTDWSAIEGVTIEEYVALSEALARRSLVGQKSIDDWLMTQGVHPGTWGRITTGWSVRMARSPEIRRRYSACVRARRATTGPTPLRPDDAPGEP